jgi:hypothetical protein
MSVEALANPKFTPPLKPSKFACAYKFVAISVDTTTISFFGFGLDPVFQYRRYV